MSRIFYRCVDWNWRCKKYWSNWTGVASFTDAWIETLSWSIRNWYRTVASFTDAWIETYRGWCRRRYWKVASFTDAWIETVISVAEMWNNYVASFTDAWIETFDQWDEHKEQMVASFTDAWIETVTKTFIWLSIPVASFTDAWIETNFTPANFATWYVASFTDAWIETGITVMGCHTLPVASFTDAWIETSSTKNNWPEETSHLLQMRGLKQNMTLYHIPLRCRIFYRCVDWNNPETDTILNQSYVASFTDAWIETWQIATANFALLSHLLQMRGLKPRAHADSALYDGRIFYRCVDWNY